MKKNVEIKGKIASAYGKQLHELDRRELNAEGKPNPDGAALDKFPVGHVINYVTTYDKFETVDEVKAANKWPDDEDIVSMVNNKTIANAKQKKMQEVQDENGLIKPSLETDVNLQLVGMYKILIASGKHTPDSAKALALQNLGMDTWPEGLKAA